MTTLEKIFRAASDEDHIEKLSRRLAELEQAILDHKRQVTMDGMLRGRNVDLELWETVRECWEVDDEPSPSRP